MQPLSRKITVLFTTAQFAIEYGREILSRDNHGWYMLLHANMCLPDDRNKFHAASSIGDHSGLFLYQDLCALWCQQQRVVALPDPLTRLERVARYYILLDLGNALIDSSQLSWVSCQKKTPNPWRSGNGTVCTVQIPEMSSVPHCRVWIA